MEELLKQEFARALWNYIILSEPKALEVFKKYNTKMQKNAKEVYARSKDLLDSMLKYFQQMAPKVHLPKNHDDTPRNLCDYLENNQGRYRPETVVCFWWALAVNLQQTKFDHETTTSYLVEAFYQALKRFT